MKTYSVSYSVVGGGTVEVESTSTGEAIKAAQRLNQDTLLKDADYDNDAIEFGEAEEVE